MFDGFSNDLWYSFIRKRLMVSVMTFGTASLGNLWWFRRCTKGHYWNHQTFPNEDVPKVITETIKRFLMKMCLMVSVMTFGTSSLGNRLMVSVMTFGTSSLGNTKGHYWNHQRFPNEDVPKVITETIKRFLMKMFWWFRRCTKGHYWNHQTFPNEDVPKVITETIKRFLMKMYQRSLLKPSKVS